MNKLFLLSFLFTFSFFACKTDPIGGDLENSNWTLAALKDGSKLISLPDDNQVSLVFGSEELNGKATCNSYFADLILDGATISIVGLGSTEMACDELDFENRYFQVLGKAQNYSVLKNKLIIFSENGQLTFTSMSGDAAAAEKFANGAGKLTKLFPALEGDIMPHLYPIVRVDNPGNYPFKGSIIDTSFYKYFGGQSSEIWNTTGGDVLAVGKYGEFYICRVPGRYVSSDIALFQLKNGQLKRSETVAWAWCDEGWCNQQDAWLKDINQDGRMDLVQHYTLTDDEGKIREERLSVMVQAEDGTFELDNSLQPDKSQFKMAKI